LIIDLKKEVVLLKKFLTTCFSGEWEAYLQQENSRSFAAGSTAMEAKIVDDSVIADDLVDDNAVAPVRVDENPVAPALVDEIPVAPILVHENPVTPAMSITLSLHDELPDDLELPYELLNAINPLALKRNSEHQRTNIFGSKRGKVKKTK
jgi:hypothetical protein